MCLVESQDICLVETQVMCCVGSLGKKEAFPKSLKREVNIAFDNHFEVTLGGILAPKGAAGDAKVASEAPKCSQGDCQGRLGLEKACIRGPKDVQEEPRVSIVRISGVKVTSK